MISRVCMSLIAVFAAGCAGFCPIPGRAVENVDPALLASARPRTPARTIDPGLLGQPRPRAHVVDSGDVLGVFIEGVLGTEEEGPPVTAPIQLDANGLVQVVRSAPDVGYPITVAQDGTITLPQSRPINVRGMTLGEVRAELRRVYVEGEDSTLKEGREKIVVTLQKPRTVRVLVVRKDREAEPQFVQPPDYRRVEDGRGSGVLVELPIYENDVIHAIVASGGMPSQDAENAVRVVRAGGAWAGLGPVDQELCPGWSTAVRRPLPAFGHSTASNPAAGPIVQASAVAGHSVGGVVGAQPTMTIRSQGFADATPPMLAFGSGGACKPSLFGPGCGGGGCDAGGCDAGTCDSIPRAARRGDCRKPALFGGGRCRDAGCDAGGCDGFAGGWSSGVAGGFGGGFASVGHGGDYSLPVVSGPVAFDAGPYCDMTIDNPHVRLIPLTLLPGECVPFDRCDVLLRDGDIVFVESRAKEFFYTSGLLGGGKYPLPRDEDLDLLDAIALVDSQQRVVPTRAVGGVSSLNQDVTVGASRVVVFREAPGGRTVPIRLNLNEIKRNPNKSILIQPGDRVYLQYTRLEALAAGFERHFLDGTVLGVASGIQFSQ